MEYFANDESEEEQEMVESAEWIQNSKKPVTCPFGKKEPESYGFDITKAQMSARSSDSRFRWLSNKGD